MFKKIVKLSALCFLVCLVVTGCVEGSSNDNSNCKKIDSATQSLKQDNISIIKSLPTNSGGVYFLQEILSNLQKFPGQRSLKRLDCGWNIVFEYAVDDSQSLIDFVEHPSGELSLIIVSEAGYQLHRIDKDGTLLGQLQIEGLSAPFNTGDVVDLSESGEDILFAAKSSDLSVKLYRYQYSAVGGFSYQWDTMVEPATSAFGWIMDGGSYDTFEQLAQPYQVSLTTDSEGNAYIAVPGLTALLFHHNEHFSENLESILHSDDRMNNWPQLDAIVTKISADGDRIYSVVAGTTYPDEMYGIKVFGESMYVFGRATRQAGNLWDGFVTKMKTSSGEIEFATLLDVQDGDIIYDLTKLESGNLFAVGATNWTQNPVGFSVSENSEKLAVLLDGNGLLISRYEMTDGERHNQLRSVTDLDNDSLLISGFENGPGTHSGDADSSLVRADGVLQTFVLP